MTSKYAGVCKTCTHAFPAGAKIRWTRTGGAHHATAADCAAATRAAASAPPPTPRPTLDLSGLVAFLAGAKAAGLKWPKLRVLAPDGRGELRLSLSGSGSAKPGSVVVKLDGEWIAGVWPTGEGTGRLRSDAALTATLVAVAADPVAAAKAYAAVMCCCCFCGLALTDTGSVDAGYGATCAKKWGLPHKALGTAPLLAPTAPVGAGLAVVV